jgi:hypothetical protein
MNTEGFITRSLHRSQNTTLSHEPAHNWSCILGNFPYVPILFTYGRLFKVWLTHVIFLEGTNQPANNILREPFVTNENLSREVHKPHTGMLTHSTAISGKWASQRTAERSKLLYIKIWQDYKLNGTLHAETLTCHLGLDTAMGAGVWRVRRLPPSSGLAYDPVKLTSTGLTPGLWIRPRGRQN